MPEIIPIDSRLVADLAQAFQTMAEAKFAAQDSIRADQGEYAIFMPTFSDNADENHSNEAREYALASISQFYKEQDSEVKTGLLCASPNTVACIRTLNASKTAFKNTVLAIRKKYDRKSPVPGKQVVHLLDKRIQEYGYRSEALKQAMSTVGISQLDLKKCYAEVRIMKEGLDVFCWTWATKHTRTLKVDMQEAEKRVESYFEGNENALEINRRLLAQCKPGETLIEKVAMKNQLRANYAYVKEGKTIRESRPISGVVIVQSKTLPRYVWREDPKVTGFEPPQVKRHSTIDENPFIPQLSLHRYVR